MKILKEVLDAVDTTPEMMRALTLPVIFLGAANDSCQRSDELLASGACNS